MKIFNKEKVENLWYVCGNFGELNGEYHQTECSFKSDAYTLTQTLSKNTDGVYVRKDIFKNTSDSPLTLFCLKSRFTLDGGDYEVYTQYNGWQNESRGAWQPLVTEVTAAGRSLRTSYGANPYVALWNKQTNRGIAFHLLPDSSWKISVSRTPLDGEKSCITVEMGIDSSNLALNVPAKESLSLPEIIYYEFTSKLDMDCFKLHRYCIDNFPQKRLPVMYNTWLYRFDKITFENVMEQIEPAKELGVEYFVIDAGWFGLNPTWSNGIGDWAESLTFGFKGRMLEIAEAVRKASMKFGLWLEIERAVDGAQILKTHGEYFLKNNKGSYFLDFANEDARNYMLDTVCEIIEKYGLEYIKFDFNADLCFDMRRSAFTEYFKGYRKFIQKLRNTYPDIYFCNCASGGMRMNLSNCRDFDSFWHSDCQSIHEGIRLFKDAVLRLPPQVFDRWAVIESSKNNLMTADGNIYNPIISTSDAILGHIEGVNMSYLKGFLSGGPLAFSCDLTKLLPEHFDEIKEHISQFKQDRDFWKSAECRIKADTDSLLVLQFNNRDSSKIVIQVFCKRVMQNGIFLYPDADPCKKYKTDTGEMICGKELSSDGIYLPFAPNTNFKMNQLTLTAQK